MFQWKPNSNHDDDDDDVTTDTLTHRIDFVTHRIRCCWTCATIKTYQIDVSWIFYLRWISLEIINILAAKYWVLVTFPFHSTLATLTHPVTTLPSLTHPTEIIHSYHSIVLDHLRKLLYACHIHSTPNYSFHIFQIFSIHKIWCAIIIIVQQR